MLQMMMRFQPRVEIENEAICSWVLDAQYISNFREIMQRKSLKASKVTPDAPCGVTYFLSGGLYVSVTGIILPSSLPNKPCRANI